MEKAEGTLLSGRGWNGAAESIQNDDGGGDKGDNDDDYGDADSYFCLALMHHANAQPCPL